ncbi:sigma 54-interacting transcriptional regulator [Paludibaculum fermentans]|uniref:sigma 54-interacting transcriptional regulator n=1 Tax=Paludibaculum fermentans TaxID=1473598 RepID=UPI003EBC285E
MQLSEYSLERLRDDGELVLYRARAAEPELPSALLLAPASTRPSPETLRKIDHEYSLRSELDPAWAARPMELSDRNAQLTLVLEDPGGETLDGLLAGAMELTQFLRIAVSLATALSGLHGRRLIHKDVKPSNVLVNSVTGEVRLIGFGIASRLRREHQAPEPPEFIAGTLPYMAPEQTGRMNRSVDSRSDLYALGVTLYEMLTGSLPFAASEPIEWVHCHIARHPPPPHAQVKSIPACVSAIVMKLLAKTPEERYQTASGVESDLRHCLAEWEAHGCIADFLPGQHDAPDRLLIPEKLYGRAKEIETLLGAFDRVVAGSRPELVLVSGYSGIGKSAVVNELHRPLVPPRGLFASGKFDQYKRDIPYATLAQAFQSLTRPLLSKSEAELGQWRKALHEALDANGQLMVDLVPELKAIIGEQPPVPELPQQDAQRRFHQVFRQFISVFARPEHPLALFLDDLQWLDAATLDLLEDLLSSPDMRHLMLIGAYRDNEVDAGHPLVRKLGAMREAGALLQDIVLAPLTREDLEQLISDSLHCDTSYSGPLAQLLHDKTSGNPFFAIQFLSALFEEGLLTFEHVEGRWLCDLDGIHAKGYTDNVVELMVRKLSRLIPEARNALKQLACLGHSAEFTMLQVVCEDSMEQLHAQLEEAAGAGFILRLKDSYRFLHDRVQEAAYSLIPEEERAQAHLRIGRRLAAHGSQKEREEGIFEIVNQLNRGSALIGSREEKDQLAEFNLVAGKRAKASTAYVSALHYLRAGAALLGDAGWQRRPELMFALEFHRAECEFLTGELAEAEARLEMLATCAVGPVDQGAVTCVRIDLYTTLNRSDLAIEVALSYLRHLGAAWPPHPTEEEMRREYDRIWSLLAGRRIEELIDLPVMSKPESVAAVEVMDKALPPALFTDTNLFPLLLWRIVNFSLEHGNTDASCYAYVHGGTLAGARFGNNRAGFQLGQVGYDLVEKRGLKRFKARTHIGFGVYTVSWTRHWRMARELIRNGFDAAKTIGDVTWAAYSWHNLIGNLIATGEPLADVQREAEQGLEFVRKTGFGLVIDNISTQLALIHTLRGSTAPFGCFHEADFDEQQVERRLSSDPGSAFAACWYWVRKLQARFFAGDYPAAVDAASQAQALLWTSERFLEEAEACFYTALSHAAACDAAHPVEYRQHVEALAGCHKQLLAWAEHCPDNFENRVAVVGAEIARLEGRVLEAEQLYEQAIRSAHSNGFVNNEAIAYEAAARFYAGRGLKKFADAYLLEARYCYQRWGADGKVAQLDHLYPQLKQESPIPAATGTILAPTDLLDLATVIKVSRAVSGEVVLEKLVDSLMRAAIEHAGAERGLLILPRGDHLLIEAEAHTGGDDIRVDQRETSVSAAVLPESVVRYAMRAREDVILDDAAAENPFSGDAYIPASRVRSMLCLPLINQAKIAGVLYLENKLAVGAFTADRIKVLKLLASQAAISLQNAHLYRELDQAQTYLSEAQRLSQTGSVGWIPASNELIWSNETYRIFQYDPAITPTAELVLARVHPEDRALVQEMIDRASRTGADWNIDHRLLMPDGAVKHIHVVAHAIREDSTDEVRFVGAIMDVTAARQSQQALEQAFLEIKKLKDQLQSENIVLREEVDKASMFEQIVGTSPPLRAVLSRISKVAPTDSSVLITGETGTGKELVARAIHKRSRRSERAFVSVNCAAIPRDLIASELFGHEKGAFTGATQRRQGRFELAEGGTIFLDEVGELPAETQIALLRVLQEREFQRIGGAGTIRADVRVIAATNRDLKAAIAAGTFRSDLYYRLDVFPIEIPSLRERREDIPLLVGYFIDRFARQAGKSFRTLSKRSLDLLQAYPWPGNIRELQNVIERSVIVCDTEEFAVDESWLSQQPAAPVPASGHESLRRLPAQEKEIIEAALRESRGRVYGPSGAAARLGIPRSTLEHKIRSFRINKNRFKIDDPPEAG